MVLNHVLHVQVASAAVAVCRPSRPPLRAYVGRLLGRFLPDSVCRIGWLRAISGSLPTWTRSGGYGRLVRIQNQ